MKNLYSFLCFVLMLHYHAFGQSSYAFHHLSTSDGLSNNHVKAILQDNYGFLWVGTESGLNRYDGYHVKSYASRQGMPYSLLSDDISSLQEDGQGNIWIHYGNTYAVYQREKDRFLTDYVRLINERGMEMKEAKQVYIDSWGDWWIVCRDSLSNYRIKTKQWKQYSLRNEEILDLSDDGKQLYVMYQSGHLQRLDIRQGVWHEIPLPGNLSTQRYGEMRRIYIDKGKRLWLFSNVNSLLYYLDHKNNQWKEVPLNPVEEIHNNFIRSLVDDGNGKIWIATGHKGLYTYDKRSSRLSNIQHDPLIHSSLLANSLECLHLDKDGTLWVGYTNKGISCYHEKFQKFINFQNKDFNNVSAILEDRNGTTWLGTDGHGLICKRANEDSYRKITIPGKIVVSLLEDQKGRLWIGTYLNGLFCYENGKMKQYTKENSALSDNSIWSLQQDRYGYLWIATLWGTLQRMNPDIAEWEDYLTEEGENLNALSLSYAGGDKLYAGTLYGICVLDIVTGKRTMHYGNAKGSQRFPQMSVRTLYMDEQNILWMGHNQGLTAWDMKKDTIYSFNKSNGLCDNIVRGIGEDALHQLWVTTSNGCSVLKVTQKEGGALLFGIDNFSIRDGLMDNYFNQNAIFRLRSGDMLLGETDGYTLVNPNKLDEQTQPLTKVTFTALRIGNQQIEVDSLYNGRLLLDRSMEQMTELRLKYSDAQVAIEYSTMDLMTPDRVRYAYQLEGLNEQWIYTSDNKIVFTTLPAGKYKLLIKARNSDGVWNDEPSVLTIIVQPPFWLSIYAYIFYIFFIIGITVFWWKQLQKKHQRKLEQQRWQLEQEQMVRINEMKLKFFTNISHDFRTPLTLILTPLQVILEELKEERLLKKLKAVYRNAEQLLNLVNELLDFRKLDVGAETLRPTRGDFGLFIRDIATAFNLYAADRHMDFSIEDEAGSISTLFDTDKVRKIMTNLLSNAFKYTQDEGRIVVRVFRQDDSIGVSIIDSGSGISDEDKKHIFERFYQTSQKSEKTGSGIGLHIANEYVRLHDGTITVADNLPQGCIFTFTIPIVEPDLKEEMDLLPAEVDAEVQIIGSEADEERVQKEKERPILLLVEDNKDFIEFMFDSLSDEFVILKAYNGQEALNCLAANDVNFIISDIMMPVMDGLELCRRVKTNINWSHIPVILLTARTAEESKLQGFEFGADDYITKPFNFSMLKLRIHKFMEWTEKSHQAFNQKRDVSPSEITITSLDEQLITKAIKVVEEHMDDPDLSVEILSVAVGLTRGHLYKKLTYITGKGPLDFIRTLRLKRAKQLLEESQLQIAEIAYAVGFNSPKIFTRNFRNEFGISPSEYIRSLK